MFWAGSNGSFDAEALGRGGDQLHQALRACVADGLPPPAAFHGDHRKREGGGHLRADGGRQQVADRRRRRSRRHGTGAASAPGPPARDRRKAPRPPSSAPDRREAPGSRWTRTRRRARWRRWVPWCPAGAETGVAQRARWGPGVMKLSPGSIWIVMRGSGVTGRRHADQADAGTLALGLCCTGSGKGQDREARARETPEPFGIIGHCQDCLCPPVPRDVFCIAVGTPTCFRGENACAAVSKQPRRIRVKFSGAPHSRPVPTRQTGHRSERDHRISRPKPTEIKLKRSNWRLNNDRSHQELRQVRIRCRHG
jgi:hypothetical protein